MNTRLDKYGKDVGKIGQDALLEIFGLKGTPPIDPNSYYRQAFEQARRRPQCRRRVLPPVSQPGRSRTSAPPNDRNRFTPASALPRSTGPQPSTFRSSPSKRHSRKRKPMRRSWPCSTGRGGASCSIRQPRWKSSVATGNPRRRSPRSHRIQRRGRGLVVVCRAHRRVGLRAHCR